MLAPPGTFVDPIDGKTPIRFAYMGVATTTTTKEPLFLDPNSVVYARDFRSLPAWVCYDSLVRKTTTTTKHGGTTTTTTTTRAVMKRLTPILPTWLSHMAQGSPLLTVGEPLAQPPPSYDATNDCIQCAVTTKFGTWEIPSQYIPLQQALSEYPKTKHFLAEDASSRYFARFLLEGKVFSELNNNNNNNNRQNLLLLYTDDPSIVTRSSSFFVKKVTLLVSALSSHGIDSKQSLCRHWATIDKTFLYPILSQHWIREDQKNTFQSLWKTMVLKYIHEWKEQQQQQAAAAAPQTQTVVPKESKKSKKKKKKKKKSKKAWIAL